MRKILTILALLMPMAAYGAQFEASRMVGRLIQSTVANLPSSPASGTVRIVTDGADGTDCDTGLGVSVVLCLFDGSEWITLSGGASDHGGLTGLSDDDHSAIYIKFEAAATAGSCDRNGQIQSVVADLKIYPCFSNGGNPVEIGDMIVNYVQITGDSGATTADASDDVLNIAGGVGLTTTATSDTLTIDIDNHVKSVFFPAASLIGDGTNCPATPTAVTINSGPKIYTFICGDNDASTLYGVAHMPDSWNGGTVTFSQSYIQTAADTSALNGDIAAQCRGNAETPSSTWGTEVAIDDAGVTGSNANDWTVSSAVTPAGTCAGGDMLYFRWQMDATGTTTAVATLHFLGFKMEYTVVGAGSD